MQLEASLLVNQDKVRRKQAEKYNKLFRSLLYQKNPEYVNTDTGKNKILSSMPLGMNKWRIKMFMNQKENRKRLFTTTLPVNNFLLTGPVLEGFEHLVLDLVRFPLEIAGVHGAGCPFPRGSAEEMFKSHRKSKTKSYKNISINIILLTINVVLFYVFELFVFYSFQFSSC